MMMARLADSDLWKKVEWGMLPDGWGRAARSAGRGPRCESPATTENLSGLNGHNRAPNRLFGSAGRRGGGAAGLARAVETVDRAARQQSRRLGAGRGDDAGRQLSAIFSDTGGSDTSIRVGGFVDETDAVL